MLLLLAFFINKYRVDIFTLLHRDAFMAGIRVAPEDGEKVTQPPFRGRDPFAKTKTGSIIGITLISQVFEGLTALPAVGSLPGDQKKKETGSKGFQPRPDCHPNRWARTGRKPLKSTRRSSKSKSDSCFQINIWAGSASSTCRALT